jgi:hypothetical protein
MRGKLRSSGLRLTSEFPLSFIPPVRPMFQDPIEERLFEADIAAGFFTLDPFVFQNLFALGEELFVEHGILHELRLLGLRSYHLGIVFHTGEARSIKSA